jgi:hypothetical protein
MGASDSVGSLLLRFGVSRGMETGPVQKRAIRIPGMTPSAHPIGREIGRQRNGHVRRIHIHEVSGLCLHQRFAKIPHVKLYALQSGAGRQHVLPIVQRRVLVRADWHVEFTASVDAPQTIETGLVEKNHPGGTLHDFGPRQVVPTPHEVIVTIPIEIIAGEVVVQPRHQLGWEVSDGSIRIYKLAVDVAQPRTHVRKTVLEVKKDGTATDERLEVAVDLPGKQAIELLKQLGFSAHPF